MAQGRKFRNKKVVPQVVGGRVFFNVCELDELDEKKLFLFFKHFITSKDIQPASFIHVYNETYLLNAVLSKTLSKDFRTE